MNDTITTQYRVIATTTTGFDSKTVDSTVKWQGSDIDELSREFPPSNIMFADPFDQKEIEGGFIITRFTFEQQLADGSWENIDDPRRRLTPMTDYEHAVDAENRRDFPGDYVTSDCDQCEDYGCPECDDPNQVDCKHCNDYGCAKCDPNWCTACNDHGCATCDPGNACLSCQRYCESEVLSDSGNCQDCEYYASLRYCDFCGHELKDSDEGDLCVACVTDLSRPTCSNNCHEYADGDDGLCSGCRFDIHMACVDCNYYLRTEDDELCDVCRQYERELRQYNAWWRRAVRVCMFWRS